MTADVVFSRLVKVEALPRDGLTQKIEATPAERVALAADNDLADIAKLTAEFVIKRSGKGVRVVGTVHAEVSQTCVVSLDPFPVTIDESIDVRFAQEARDRPGRAEPEVVALDAEDAPDPIVDGKVDLGALAAEFIALALDPYPRKPGVEFAPPPEEAPDPSPFDALGKIAKKKV